MNKKFKNLFLAGAIMVGLAGVAVSCTDYDGDINDLAERVTKLEGTVSDLQAAINGGCVITDVTSTTNGVKVTLSNGKSFEITNGTNGKDGKDGVNGKDGANGQNGSVVTIGANGNWFIDGKDTGFASKGADGKDGKDGKDGVNGENGKDAVQVWYEPCTDKTSDAYGYWVKYTYDPATKQTTSEVTTKSVFAEGGVVTAVYNTDDNTLTFHNVEGAEDGVVVVNLSANLKSLALIPEALMEGLGYIEFPYVVAVKDGADYVVVSSAPVDVTYRLNPENADVTANAWSFINRNVKTYAMGTRSKSDSTNLVKIVDGPVVDGGEATFTITLNGDVQPLTQIYKGGDLLGANEEGEGDKNVIIALQTKVDAETITSDYSYVSVADAYYQYELAHKDFTKEDVSPVNNKVRPYRNEPISIDEKVDAEFYAELASPELLYTETLDLKNYVTLVAEGANLPAALADSLGLNVNYKFELCNEKGEAGKAYLGKDGRTDQNKFVTLSEDGVMAVDPEFLNQSTRPAVNRTPLVRVIASVKNSDNTYNVDSCYIKVRIVEEKATPVEPEKPVTYYYTATEHHVDFCGDKVANFANGKTGCPDYTTDSLVVTWEEVNQNVLGSDRLNLSYEAFLQEYNTKDYELCILEINKDAKTGKVDTTYVPANQYKETGKLPEGIDFFVEAPEEWNTSTNIMYLLVTSKAKMPSEGTIEFAYKAKDNSYKTPNVGFKFSYTISAKNPTTHTHDFANPVQLILNPDYLLGNMNVPVEAKPASKYVPSTENYDVYAGVRVKGKAGADKNFVYSSSLIEHFIEYGKNIKLADDATISFEIMHSSKDWKVNYGDNDYKFIQNGETKDIVTFTAAEFNAIIASPATSPDIKYMKSFLAEDCNVLVKVTETCTYEADVITPAKEKVGYYYVVFQTPFKAVTSNSDVVLGTFKSEADTTYIPADFKVVERENEKNVIYTFENGKMVASDYAKTQYGLEDVDGSVAFTTGGELTYPYADNTKASFGGCLTYGSDNEGLFVAWDNLGTDLLVDKYADYNLTVKIGDLYTLDLKGKVTVLSTANTAAKWASRADKVKAEEAAKAGK